MVGEGWVVAQGGDDLPSLLSVVTAARILRWRLNVAAVLVAKTADRQPQGQLQGRIVQTSDNAACMPGTASRAEFDYQIGGRLTDPALSAIPARNRLQSTRTACGARRARSTPGR